jgi:hypothetical protein
MGIIFGHNYEARYSKGASGAVKADHLLGFEMVDLVEATKAMTYHHDICTRCGDIKGAANA